MIGLVITFPILKIDRAYSAPVEIDDAKLELIFEDLDKCRAANYRNLEKFKSQLGEAEARCQLQRDADKSKEVEECKVKLDVCAKASDVHFDVVEALIEDQGDLLEKVLSESRDSSWIDSPWVMFTFGFVVGGGAIATGVYVAN